MDSLAELEKWLNGLPDQQDGAPGPFCDAGEPYVEFFQRGYARPDDVAMIERDVAEQMAMSLNRYFASRKGRIYWGKRFETDVGRTVLVTRFDEQGPDVEFTTDRRCFKDTNWIAIRCYCRLYRAANPVFVNQY
jgi:hypothetical protein